MYNTLTSASDLTAILLGSIYIAPGPQTKELGITLKVSFNSGFVSKSTGHVSQIFKDVQIISNSIILTWLNS
jgi:hypothetical protein